MCAKELIKKEVKSFKREIVRHELEERTSYLRLDKNENLSAFNQDVFEKLKLSFSQEILSAYPNLAPLYKKVAKMATVDESQLFIATGSDLAIKAIYDSCIDSNDHIVFHTPSYFMYEVYARQCNAQFSFIPVRENWKPDLKGMLDAVNEKTKMVIIESPNGFLGSKLSFKDLQDFAQNLEKKNILLIIDEAYLYVENKTSPNLELVKKLKNVILVHTFSKAHGLAGARFGFLLAHKDLIQHISKVRPLYEVSALTAWVAEWHLDHPELLLKAQNVIKESKHYLLKELEALDVEVRDTSANFILLRLSKDDASFLEKEMKKRNILIRRSFTEQNIKTWSRITVSGMEESKQFLKCLKEIIDDLEKNSLIRNIRT